MNPSTLAIALLVAVVVWGLIVRNLTAKPWAPANAQAGLRDIAPLEQPATRVAFYVLLAVITSFFLLFIAAYTMRMDPHHGGDWHSVDKPGILWANTVLLILASGAMQWARNTATSESSRHLRFALVAGGLLTLLFLGGQVMAWRQIGAANHLVQNAAGAFFVLLTALHALHLIGGLVVWVRAVKSLRHPGSEAGILRIELCSIYWHYLLVVWLVLFVLLLST